MRWIFAALAALLFVTAAAAAQSTQGNGGEGAPQNLSQPYQRTAPAPPLKTMALKDVNNPSDTLGSASVEDSKGQSVGHVQAVNTTKQGEVRSIDVALNTKSAGKVVSIRANELRYVPSSNMLRASLSMDRIAALPAVPRKPL